MSEPLITYLTNLFRNDLDAKSDAATKTMAKEWLKVEQSLQSEILALSTELAAPPGAVKLDPITSMVMTMQQNGYAPAYISKLLAAQGIFKIPDVPQPEAKQLKDWQLAKLQRYVRLLAQVQNEIDQFTGQVSKPIIEQLQADAAFSGIQQALTLIDATVSSAGGDVIDLSFDRLNVEAVQNIVAIAGAGKPLGDLLGAAYPLAAGGITDRLIYGVAAGWNPRKTAKSIIEDGLSMGLNHALLICRDQMVRSSREGARQQYLKSGIIRQYRRLAAKQSRSCLACLALDNSVWPSEELMPLHPQDRCLVGGQLISTNDGLVPIEDVEWGAEVLTHVGRFRPVVKTSARRYTGRVTRITYEGKELLCTPDHKLLTESRGWVEAQKLLPTDNLTLP